MARPARNAPAPPARAVVQAPTAEVAERAPAPAAVRPRPTRGVLGATFTDAAKAALSLHPAFYVLLFAAIAALAAASVPAARVPSPWIGAALARRRPEVTLAGIGALVAVLVGYALALA